MWEFHINEIVSTFKKNYHFLLSFMLTILATVMVILMIGIYPCLYFYFYHKSAEIEMQRLINNISAQSKNSREIIKTLSDWFNKTIDYTSLDDLIFNLQRKFSPCISYPEITFITRSGRCEEWALLYHKLLNMSNISSRIVKLVEDHALVEVYIDGEWLPVEPKNGFSNFEFYKKWKNVSKAFVCMRKKKIDVTPNYAHTGTLFIKTQRDDKVLPFTQICIYSKYLMFADPQHYKIPQLVACNKSNDYGMFTEIVGKGIYKITAKKFLNPFVCYKTEQDNVLILPNRVNKIVLRLRKENPINCFFSFITSKLRVQNS